jgi:hypothetical protein
VACSSGGPPAPRPQVAAPHAEPNAPSGAAPVPGVPDETLEDDVPAPAPNREMVTIKLIADVRRQAKVSWGRKDLGVAPLEIKRPRGSGPLDLLVTAPGCIPLHTRAFTDRDETLTLRLYTEKEASALVGWRPPSTP